MCFSQSNPVLVVSIYFTLNVQATMPCNSSKTQAKKLFVAEPELNMSMVQSLVLQKIISM
jgi:hypothetical protein